MNRAPHAYASPATPPARPGAAVQRGAATKLGAAVKRSAVVDDDRMTTARRTRR
ncbi:hypothetical protein AB0H29_15935 [Streptomyces thermolilacinus]